MSINYASKYAGAIDEKFTLAALSTPFVNRDYDFTGVRTVKIYSLPTASMNDYSLTGSSRYGAPAELENAEQELSLGRDRSFTFTIDRRNYGETMMANSAGAALARQINEVVIPEVDSYRFHRMAVGCGTLATGSMATDGEFTAFLSASAALTEDKVPQAGRVAVVTPAFYKALLTDSKFVRAGDMAQSMLMQGQLGEVDGIAVFRAPSSYLPEGSDFLIGHASAVTAPQKLTEYKIHDNPPGINGWLVEGRVCYDAFVLHQKKDALYLHMSSLGTLTGSLSDGKLVLTGGEMLLAAGAELVYAAGASQAAPTLGLDVSAWTAGTAGGTLTYSTNDKIAVALAIGGKAVAGCLIQA